MSQLDELVAELAPGGVPLRPLGELGEFVRGNGLQKSDLTDEGFPAIHYGQVHTHYGVWTDVTKSFTSPELATKLRHARPGDLVVATTSEDDAAVAKATAWLGDGDVAVSGDAYIYRHTLDPRFVAYFFASERFQEQKGRFVTGTKVRRISSDALSKIRIPVPPAEVQRKIVRILDQFTQLEAELEAELEARQQQYAHYRDQLLAKESFTAPRWRSLSEIASISTGMKPVALSEVGKFAYINAGNEPSGYLDSFNREGGALTIPSRGQGSAGHVGFQVERFWCGPLCYEVRSRSAELIDKFLYYYLRNFQDDLVSLRKIGSIPAVNKGDLGKVLVPVIDVDEQWRIVAILDKFDALVNDLSIGLPAELIARRKQYEYYRDKLMTFEEAAA